MVMDPLSITTGIITIVGAGSTIQKQFKKILALKHAPAALIALNNEVNDMHRIAKAVHDLLRRSVDRNDSMSSTDLVEKLKVMETLALDIEKLMSYELTVVAADGQNTRVDRSRWLRSGTKLQDLKAKIQSNKADLTLELGIFNSAQAIDLNLNSLAILQRFDDFDQEIKNSFQTIFEYQEQSRNSLAGYDQRYHSRLLTDQITEEHQDEEPDSTMDLVASTQDVSDLDSYDSVGSRSAVPAPSNHLLITAVAPSTCGLNCCCSCHKTRRLRSPQFLNQVIGSLFIGYRSSPVFTSACNNSDCRLKATHITYTYAFPRWFLKKVLYTSVSLDRSGGPELNLRVMNVRDWNSKAFNTILRDRSEFAFTNIKYLLENGQASILDVSPNGQTLLYYAVYYDELEIVDLLLKSGSDALYQDEAHRSPYMLAWASFLVSPSASNMRMSALFPSIDYEPFEFSALHRAVLSLSGSSLEAALEMTKRSQIDSGDAVGRTALTWAAEKGDLVSVSRLLECGADPNLQDARHSTALHEAAGGGHTECIEKLLLAKASLEIKNVAGNTPLMRAVLKRSNYNVLKTLLRHGAKVDQLDIRGLTVLYLAICHYRSAEEVHCLISHGADINACGQENGWSLLFEAIRRNSYQCLAALLEYDYLQLVPNLGTLSFLDAAALSSDSETLKILISASDGFDLSCNERQELVGSALAMAEIRMEINQGEQALIDPTIRLNEEPAAWFEFFQDLCHHVLNPPGDYNHDRSTTDDAITDDEPLSNDGEESSSETEEWQDAPEIGQG